MKLKTSVAAVLTAAFLTAGAAHAQQQDAPITDAVLENFAVAYLSVQDIVREYQTKVENASTDAEVEQLRSFYGNHVTNAVESEDLSVDEYNSIARAIEANPALRERATEKIQGARETEQ